MTLTEMLDRSSRNFPQKAAIIHHGVRITYKELDELTGRLARALISKGLNKGDRVGLMLPRTPELVISFLGVAKALGIAAPINFELSDLKIGAILSHISPRCLIVHKQFLGLAKRAVPADSNILVIPVGGGSAGDAFSWDEMIKGKGPDSPVYDIKEDDAVYLNYTSGSTGNSKSAVTTHSNIYWNTLAAVNALKLTPDDVHLCMFAPFAHPHELFARPLYLGGTMVLLDNIYPKSLAKAVSDNGITCIMGLAPMYETLLELLEHKTYDLSSLRVPESGGMYTRPELIERFRQMVGVPIIPVWGSTETSGIAIANTLGEPIIPGSVGKPCISYEVKIVDESGSEVETGETGEMIFKGPAVVRGYYKDPDNNQSCFNKGWYYSGDLGKKDEEGNFFFIERKTGMMKVAGHKVYPLEIEVILMGHPEIKETVVISAGDRLRGEVPKAIIVTKNGTGLTEKAVMDFCRERMAHYKVPRIVEFREQLPKTGSGKINKKQLQLEVV